MGQLDGRRKPETVVQYPLMRLVRRVRIPARAAHLSHPLPDQPFGRSVEERGGDAVIVRDVEEPEETDLLASVLVESMVDRCRDPTEEAPSGTGEEMGDIGSLLIGMPLRKEAGDTEQPAPEELGAERRRPMRIVAEEGPGDLDEGA